MSIKVKMSDMSRPQRLAALVVREGGDPTVPADRRLLIVYTGWIGATHEAGGNLVREEVVSFVPNDPNTVQTFKPGKEGGEGVQAVVTASLSSFGGEPDTAAVDRASVSLENKPFLSVDGNALVLVLKVEVAAAGGAVHGIAYQVTVLAHPDLLGPVVPVSGQVSP